MAITDQKAILTKKLACLSGFEDGAEDLLEHLLTIESREDLLDYLTQLLGNEKDVESMRKFVEDVGRIKSGETLSEVDMSSQPSAIVVQEAPAKETVLVSSKQTARAPSSSANNLASQKFAVKKLPAATATASAKASSKREAAMAKQQERQRQTNISTPTSSEKKQEDEDRSKKDDSSALTVKPTKRAQPPARGTAKFECGCFGSLHKALTNCLFCGRISCEKEGYDFCPFCGYFVEEVKAALGYQQMDEAWKHKERLLRYDREFAQRTVILDDQADYYSNQTSTWLTEEERSVAASQEQQRSDELHKRKKMQLNLGL